MSEEIAQKGLNQMVNTFKSFMKSLSKVFEEWLDKMQKNIEYIPYRKLAKQLGEGKCSLFQPDSDYRSRLQTSLKNEGIPYMNVNGYLIVKNDDLQRTQELYRELLVSQLNYFQEVSKTEFENAIAKSPKIDDKTITVFDNLNLYEFESLKAKCNDISKGFMVGTEKKNDYQYSLLVHQSSIYQKNPKKNDLCKAYLASTLSLYGPNNEIKKEQISADVRLEAELQQLRDVKETFYLVSEDDPARYIEVNSLGFSVHDLVIGEGGAINYPAVANFTRSDINYSSELQRYMDTMYDKVIVTDIDDIKGALKTGELNFKSSRPKKTKLNRAYSKVHKSLVYEINRIIKETHSEPLTIQQYEKEAAVLLESLKSKEIPSKYSKEDIDKLKEIFTSQDVKIPDYKNVIANLTEQLPTLIEKQAEKAKVVEVVAERKVHENSDRQGKE